MATAMTPSNGTDHGTLPWHPAMVPYHYPGTANPPTQPWHHSNGRHPTMAPYHVTQQWHCHGTQQWHPAMAPYPAMAPGNGTRQWRPTMAPRPVRQAKGTLPYTSPWRPAIAPLRATSNLPKWFVAPPLLLEVRTPIAKAIWGKIQLVSSQLLSVSYLPVQWVQSYHPSCLAFQNLDRNLIIDARYLTTLKVAARMRQMNTKLDANGKNFAKPPFSALLNKYPSPLFPHSVMFHGNLPNPNHSWKSFNISSQSLGHRFYRPWREQLLPSGMNEMSWREYVHTRVWIASEIGIKISMI